MKYFLAAFMMCVVFFPSIAQFGFEFKDSILVKKGTDTLSMAFSGGLNYPQFSDLDYDFDGDNDLFVFDRSSDNIRVYIQEFVNGKHFYRLEYNARSKFPADLRYRATMVDYDNDGRKDLFSYGIGGIKVYRNVGDAINGLQWTLSSNLLYSDYWGTRLNLYVSSADIPAFVDVEGDGDIDVLTFHISGEHLQYHQNQSMELYGSPDSLIFKLKNECWGGFREDLNTSTVYLNDNTLECTTGNVPGAELEESDLEEKKVGNGMPKHSGSTILALDYDNSGVLDLVLGDVAFPNLTLLMNSGNTPNSNSLMVSQDNTFPSNSLPANLQIFPAAFWVDVDFDLKKDLIICPNARTTPENEKSILFYKNVGTNQLPTFVYQTNEFLQKEMIEQGTGSQPLLFDYDKDGLKDLFVGNFYRYIPTLNKESNIAYYKNTGTITNPVFTFIDFNFLDLNTSGLGLKMAPTFGDIDGDGDEDLYIGRDNGTLSFFENTSISPGVSFTAPVNNVTSQNGTVISVGQAAHPQLFDLDKDGLLDLVIGRKTGELAYYRNVGSVSSPSFQLFNDSLGKIDVATTSSDGYAAPYFFRRNDNDTTYLFLGASDGQLHYYKGIDGHLNPSDTFELVSDNYLNIDAGAYSSFWVEDFDNDGNLNMLVGQDLGGLFHFEANPSSNAAIVELKSEPEWIVYPNPSKDMVTIEWAEEADVRTILLISSTGQLLEQFNKLSDSKLSVSTTLLAKGVYFIQLETDGGNFVRKLIKE
jgi:hypothetical protein